MMVFAVLCVIAVWDHSFDGTVTFTYDSNIFRYSREYIDDFMDQTHPYRFPFETYDDLVTTAGMDVRIRNKLFADRTTTFNFGVHVNHFAVNQQKDFPRMIAGLRQSFGAWSLKGWYQVIPGYLIRYYRNPIGSYADYIPCEVTYHTITGKATLPVLAYFNPEIEYCYRIDDYVDAFDIYDATAHRVEIQSASALSNVISVAASYAFKTSALDTVVDIDEENDEFTPDGGYQQHEIDADLLFHGIASLPVSLKLAYCYAFRNYRSEQPDDRLHFGRQDHQHTFSAGAELKIRTGMLFMLTYAYGLRRATSEIFPEIGEIKNFDQDRINAGLKFYF